MYNLLTSLCLIFCLSSLNNVKAEFKESDINVKNYGAKGDGKTDDTQSIQNANNAAQQKGVSLLFPAGTYIATELQPSTSWKGNNSTIKRKTGFNGNVYDFCAVKNKSNLSFENLNFDGSASSDPKQFNKSNYNSFTGSIGLFIYGSNNITITNCNFTNCFTGGLRIEDCNNIKVQQCNAKRSRGNFGDGFYVEQSKNIQFTNCSANDYTRIGFVVERGSSNISFDKCSAQNGHDCSVSYGGTEYNSGFWAEGSLNISFSNCTSSQNTNYGFVASALGSKNNDASLNSQSATYSFKSCTSTNANQIGFNVNSNPGIAVRVTFNDCKAINSSQPYLASLKNESDNFVYNNCTAVVAFNPKSSNDIAFMWESSTKFQKLPSITYNNCSISYSNPILENLTSKNSNSGDVGTYSGGNVQITINNMKKDNGNSPIILKCLYGSPSFIISNTLVDTTLIQRRGNISLINNSKMRTFKSTM
ncbi:hypothetical protein DVR12_08705 [Chitinophaga silvatica]|uniref:Right handed beta helix domain-containing protein n=1 Tax=Chitinophaga silvatica TaxID=2282649 RepID=A0A3E1YCC8_9BACT|nr:right-handed parallel beta-helix repeat-containing protein [Chitinophaga silvatica]RFS23953.1 hypothetical protein DVR12_08705 [Chitinophaga silvatica]